MKKFVNYGLSLVLMASLFLVSSCGEDPVETIVEAPTVTLPAAAGTSKTVEVGEEVAFKVNVTAPGIFNTFIVNQTIDGGNTTKFDDDARDSGTAPTTYEYDFSFTPAAEHAGKEIVFDFIAVDDDNKETKVTYTVNVNEVSLVEYQTVLLGGQLNTTEKSFYNVVDNATYKYSEANSTSNRSKVDLLFHYGETNKNVISSPDNEDTRHTWLNYEPKLSLANMTNSTRFRKLTTTSYAQIANANQLENAYLENQNPVESRITQLAEGQSFVFVLDASRGGRYGVAEVAKIEGTGGTNRTITLKIKVQPAANN